jgi:dienelactone hydrolase
MRKFGFVFLFVSAGMLSITVRGHSVTFPTANPAVAGGEIIVTGVLSKPEGKGPFPAVVLLHTCGGLRDHVAKDWPEFLARQGYVSLAVDSFKSRGLGPCPNGLSPPAPGARTFASRAMISDAHGALDWLERQPFVRKGRTAVMGFSLGGMAIHFSLLRAYARKIPDPAFAAAIVLYGPCAVAGGRVTMPRLDRAALPLLDIVGDRDDRILRECRELLPKGRGAELHVLPGAHHAFDSGKLTSIRLSSGGSTMLFNAAATQAARGLVAGFLKRHIGERR